MQGFFYQQFDSSSFATALLPHKDNRTHTTSFHISYQSRDDTVNNFFGNIIASTKINQMAIKRFRIRLVTETIRNNKLHFLELLQITNLFAIDVMTGSRSIKLLDKLLQMLLSILKKATKRLIKPMLLSNSRNCRLRLFRHTLLNCQHHFLLREGHQSLKSLITKGREKFVAILCRQLLQILFDLGHE